MAEMYELDWIRLPLEGAHNVRELGGYPVSGGGQTHYHRFLRADGLNGLTAADRAFLHGYGVRLVLDLRDSREVDERPDKLIADDVRIVNVPLLAFDVSDKEEIERRFLHEPPTFEFIYDHILGNKDGICRCFELISEAPDESCVLFHCAVGKDRTGVLAMLLMALAGCDKWDCVSNYVQTRPNLMRHPWYAAYWESGDSFSDSPAYALEHTWEVMEREGGVIPFLISCGLTYEQLEAVRSRLLA